MTAIANVGIADTKTLPALSLATIKEGPGSTGFMPDGIFCIGALTAPDGQFLYLSLIGRDTAFQELRGKMTANTLTSFVIEWDDGKMGGWFSRDWLGKMEYHGAKLQTALFGEVSQMILYHPLLTTPDKATQTAALPFMGFSVTPKIRQDAWQLVKHLSEVPLLDEWQDVLMDLLASLQWHELLTGFGCDGYYIKLGSDLAALISANIRKGALRVEPDGDGRYAIPEKATLDLEYGLADRQNLYGEASSDSQAEDDGIWGEAISVHTRQNLLDDGDLVDVSDTKEAREAGFKVPVALTRAVWDRFVDWDNSEVSPKQRTLGQSIAGRLWDVLYMACYAIRNSTNSGDVLYYEVSVIPKDGRSTSPRDVSLKLHSGHGDRGEHVITIMLPGED